MRHRLVPGGLRCGSSSPRSPPPTGTQALYVSFATGTGGNLVNVNRFGFGNLTGSNGSQQQFYTRSTEISGLIFDAGPTPVLVPAADRRRGLGGAEADYGMNALLSAGLEPEHALTRKVGRKWDRFMSRGWLDPGMAGRAADGQALRSSRSRSWPA
jgi:hypothetical protein